MANKDKGVLPVWNSDQSMDEEMDEAGADPDNEPEDGFHLETDVKFLGMDKHRNPSLPPLAHLFLQPRPSNDTYKPMTLPLASGSTSTGALPSFLQSHILTHICYFTKLLLNTTTSISSIHSVPH
jgi:hypothetical protein